MTDTTKINTWLDSHHVEAEARRPHSDGVEVRSWTVWADKENGWDEWKLVTTVGECREWMGY
jgi:hypothetical protein